MGQVGWGGVGWEGWGQKGPIAGGPRGLPKPYAGARKRRAVKTPNFQCILPNKIVPNTIPFKSWSYNI